jgi:hypothetical protein
MGSGSTKILSYDEAIKRCMYSRNYFNIYILYASVSQIELERIETTYRDLTNGLNEISFTSFKRDVFPNFLPETLVTVCILY